MGTNVSPAVSQILGGVLWNSLKSTRKMKENPPSEIVMSNDLGRKQPTLQGRQHLWEGVRFLLQEGEKKMGSGPGIGR